MSAEPPTVAVRYYSRTGKTRQVAEVVAAALGTRAVSVDAPAAQLAEPVDVLFVGGALYAYGLDRHLADWLDALDGTKVGRAVLFSTSWLSRHALDLMRKRLEAKGVAVSPQVLYLRSGAVASSAADVERFARSSVEG